MSFSMLKQTYNILKNSNYETMIIPNFGCEICFDIIAHHKSNNNSNNNSMSNLRELFPSLIIKFIENIDNIRPYIINEIKLISYLIRALPIIIGIKNRHSKLEDQSIYLRNHIAVVNFLTFQKIIKTPKLPMAIAKKGGFFYNIDGKKLEKLRNDQGYSRKTFANKINLSSKTISNYEHHDMRASAKHAKSIKKILGKSVVIPLDFYKYLEDETNFKINYDIQKKTIKKTEEFINEISEIVEKSGHQIFWSKSSPFDILIYSEPKEKEVPFSPYKYAFIGGTHLETKFENPKHCAQRDFINTLKQDGAMIYQEEFFDLKKAKSDRIPYIVAKELKILEKPREFKKLIHKRDHRKKC